MAGSSKSNATIVLLRVLSVASICLGLAAMMFGIPSLFWYAAGFLSAGLVILFFDLRHAFKLRRDRWRQRIGCGLILVLLCAFSIGIAFHPAEINVHSSSYEGRYKDGESIYGIVWKDDMSDLRVDLQNPTDRDYDHVDVVIGVGKFLIQDQKQITNIPVTIIPLTHQIHINLVDDNGKPTGEENRSMNGYSEVRLLCDRLPKKATIGLIFAVSAFTPEAQTATSGVPIGKEGTIIMLKAKPPYRLLMRKRAEIVAVTGSFSVWNRPYWMDRAYVVQAE